MTRKKHSSGFTLIELLVVVAIIAILTSILIPSLGAARNQAKQVRAQSDLRQIMAAYTIYYQENNNNVLLGYSPAALQNGFYEPRLNRTFTGMLANLTAMRYPWRIVPYVQNLWPILHSHEPMPKLPSPEDSDSQIVSTAYEISLFTTYGMNSYFVGGDIGADGFDLAATPPAPRRGRHVVFRSTDVQRPSELIVFGQARSFGGGLPDTQLYGNFRLNPPRFNGVQWNVPDELAVPVNVSAHLGLPYGWYKKEVVIGFFDSHVETMKPKALEDMRLWANNAQRADYDYTP